MGKPDNLNLDPKRAIIIREDGSMYGFDAEAPELEVDIPKQRLKPPLVKKNSTSSPSWSYVESHKEIDPDSAKKTPIFSNLLKPGQKSDSAEIGIV